MADWNYGSYSYDDLVNNGWVMPGTAANVSSSWVSNPSAGYETTTYGPYSDTDPWNKLTSSSGGDSTSGGSDSGGGSEVSYDSGSSSTSDYENIVPSWVDDYNKWLSDFSKSTVDQYGTSFLDSLNQAITSLQGDTPYQGKTDQYVTNLDTAYNNLSNLPSQIEAYRTSLPQQYLADLAPIKDYYNPVMDSYASRGLVNSSLLSDSLADVNKQIMQGYGQQVADANTWAAGQNLDYTKNMPTYAANVISTLSGLDTNWANRQNQAGTLAATGNAALNTWANTGLSGAQNSINTATANFQPWQTLLPLLLGS